jgi:FkbM family methyltransferase
MNLRHAAKRGILHLAPSLILNRFAPNYPREAELALVSRLCDRRRTAVDVGGSTGIYSLYMLAYARNVISFEPRPQVAERLQEKLAFAANRLRVIQAALSNQVGETTMRVPVNEGGRGTIEPENTLVDAEDVISFTVQLQALDAYDLGNIGFIKIDVEGHEADVVSGALHSIATSKPRMLIEIEERHRVQALGRVVNALSPLGYTGHFLLEGKLFPVASFDEREHQAVDAFGKTKEPYVNNFIFLPQGDDCLRELRD